jgi:2-succinyl-5-enolpyruvyl-6-hydroxy-3-cyclohexene-1-carboxylate synthase
LQVVKAPHQEPPEDIQATFAATLTDEWVRGGLRAAVVCPGSRSTPLALALADHPGVAVQVHHDERSGGFLALGLALASGRPVAVLVTSGTAAAELHPAVVEAHHAGVALVVCTADRPPELRDVGAPQTIDQNRLYGSAVRWYADPGVPDSAGRDRWRAFAARALAQTAGPPTGPVHLNLPFREPLVGTPGPLPAARLDGGPWVRAGARPSPFCELDVASSGDVQLTERIVGAIAGRAGVVVAGYGSGSAGRVLDLARALGWPVAAGPQAAAWQPSDVHVAHLDAVLRSERAHRALRPEVVLRLGAPPASRVVNEWLAASGADEVVAGDGPWSDPAGTAAWVLQGDVDALLDGLVDGAKRATAPPLPGWLARWQRVGTAASEALAGALAASPSPTEASVAADVVAGLPDGSRLVVSSSMPIRDVERYAPPRSGLRVAANRGANGIDGVVSTAVGVAVAARQEPGRAEGAGPATGLLIGDLAFLHDSNGLLGIAGRDVDLVCVVVDNDGGGIFSFLPQAGALPGPRYEQLFGTPHGLDLVALARAYGVAARRVEADVAAAVRDAAVAGGVHVLVVPSERAANVEVHRALDAAVAAAVEAALADPA